MEHIPSVDDLQRARPDLGQVEFVASGGFKAVFKATLRGRVEAVKIAYVPPDAEEDTSREEIVARVKREIDTLRMCRTNRLVSLGSIDLQMITIGGRDYLLYSEEFLTGETLRVRIRNGHRPDFEELVLLTRCLIEALDAIAQIGHIHRDVKPGNIIATGDRERPFVLLDLGIGDLLHAQVRAFNPKYKEAEGALVGEFQRFHTDIYGNRDFLQALRNQHKFFCAEENRELDLTLIDYGDLARPRGVRVLQGGARCHPAAGVFGDRVHWKQQRPGAPEKMASGPEAREADSQEFHQGRRVAEDSDRYREAAHRLRRADPLTWQK